MNFLFKRLYLDILNLLKGHQSQIEEAINMLPDSPVTEVVKAIEEVVTIVEDIEGKKNASNP